MRVLALLALTATISSCDAPGTAGPAPVASVTVMPPGLDLTVGQTASLTASPRDGGGKPLPGRVVVWPSAEPAVATVSATGLVTAVSAGTATVTATSEGQSGSATITVTPVPVASVSVTPGSLGLTVGQT